MDAHLPFLPHPQEPHAPWRGQFELAPRHGAVVQDRAAAVRGDPLDAGGGGGGESQGDASVGGAAKGSRAGGAVRGGSRVRRIGVTHRDLVHCRIANPKTFGYREKVTPAPCVICRPVSDGIRCSRLLRPTSSRQDVSILVPSDTVDGRKGVEWAPRITPKDSRQNRSRHRTHDEGGIRGKRRIVGVLADPAWMRIRWRFVEPGPGTALDRGVFVHDAQAASNKLHLPMLRVVGDAVAPRAFRSGEVCSRQDRTGTRLPLDRPKLRIHDGLRRIPGNDLDSGRPER